MPSTPDILSSLTDALQAAEGAPADPDVVAALAAAVRALSADARSRGDERTVQVADKLRELLARVEAGTLEMDERVLRAVGTAVNLAERTTREAADAVPAGAPASGDAPHAEASADQFRLSIGIVGGGRRAAEMLRMLADSNAVGVAAACAPSPRSPLAEAARDLSVPTVFEVARLTSVADLDLVVDASDDLDSRTIIESQLPPEVEVAGPAACLIMVQLLQQMEAGERQTVRVGDLKTAYERVRRQHLRLQQGHEALERANEQLERQLAEIYFIHEFFRSLARDTTVEGVTSLIADGCAGILGLEISAVYTLDDNGMLELRAAQGRPLGAFRRLVTSDEGLFARALEQGLVVVDDLGAEPDGGADLDSWSRERVAFQAAMALRSGNRDLGVILLASVTPRTLSPTERERFGVVVEQSALALQNAALHEELELLSVTDRLTELYNHGFLIQRLDEEVMRANRFGHPLSLVMLDIDDFKQFNDTHGHLRGDEVLRSVAATIRGALRDIDVAARYGGEEFVVMLPETRTEGAALVAERIRKDVEQLVFEGARDQEVRRTVSLGVAEYPLDAATGRDLVEAADAAMYRAKRTGKNRVVVARETRSDEAG